MRRKVTLFSDQRKTFNPKTADMFPTHYIPIAFIMTESTFHNETYRDYSFIMQNNHPAQSGVSVWWISPQFY